MYTISERIGQASTLLGLLLVLVTLFTSEQARSLDAERRREGGASQGARKRIIAICVALSAVTVASFLVLAPLVWDIANALVDGHADSLQGVFCLVWLLLVPLGGWQISIAIGARRIGGR
jgi:hypothetical protein